MQCSLNVFMLNFCINSALFQLKKIVFVVFQFVTQSARQSGDIMLDSLECCYCSYYVFSQGSSDTL